MYSKYEEMLVMKQVMQNYVDDQKKLYETTIANLKENLNNFSSDINNERAANEISSLQFTASLLSDYRADYESGLSVVSELNKATMCYEQAYTPEQIQPGGIAEQRVGEGNKLFHEIKTQNPNYKRIMNEISYGLFVSHDPYLDGLENGLDSKLDNLDKDFEEGKLSKEQLIFYVNMCATLSQNPDYIEYVSQFQNQQQNINR